MVAASWLHLLTEQKHLAIHTCREYFTIAQSRAAQYCVCVQQPEIYTFLFTINQKRQTSGWGHHGYEKHISKQNTSHLAQAKALTQGIAVNLFVYAV